MLPMLVGCRRMKWRTRNSSLFRCLNSQTLRPRLCSTVPTTDLSEKLDNVVGTQNGLRPSSTRSLNVLGRSARAPTGDFAIHALRRFLSSDNTTSHHPLVYSSTVIRSLYYGAESRHQLDILDSRMLSLLISLFGSLSAHPHPSFTHKMPLMKYVLEVSPQRTHWNFVLKVGKYKSERGMVLHDSDRFWLMRAELAAVQAGSSLSDDAYSATLRARAHYRAIRRHCRHPDVHAYYLETLLVKQDPRLLRLASRDLSFLLRTYNTCLPWLQRLLYRLVIQYGGYLAPQSKEIILAALWDRVCSGIDQTPHLVSGNDLLGILGDGCNWDVTTIARSISAKLFGSVVHPLNDKLRAMPPGLFSIFRPTYALPLRWSSLVLLSIFNTFETIDSSETHWTSDHPSCWQVIFGLAIIERALRDPTITLKLQTNGGILETTHSLRRQWLSVIEAYTISPDLACVVATSFFRITNALADTTLFYSCRDLERNLEGPQISLLKLFAVQYIAAVVRVQGLQPDVMVTLLDTFFPDQEQQHQALVSTVEVLAPLDTFLAYKLYDFGQARGMKLNAKVARILAVSFARRGVLRQAVLFLDGGQFSPESRGILLSVIACSLRENPRTRHPQSVFVAIASEAVALYQLHVPPGHFRGHLEQLFVILAQHGRGSQLFPAVLSIFRELPDFFQPRFFDRYCHALVRHRQISIANKLLDVITTVHPKIVRSLRPLVDRITLQVKTSRLFEHTSLCGPTSLKLSSRLRRYPGARVPLDFSLQMLLRAGRVLAAKHTFARVAATVPCARRTVLGNILLHGVARQPIPRNGRRVRKVLALLENLVGNHGFQPDRVTANILIKAMMSWRSAFTSPRLRDLFDQLVRAGYPAADYSPLQPPFGTKQTQLLASSSFSELPSCVSFENHSRPLFKMFINAFYFCNDVEAARKVVGIVKVEEYKNAMAKEARRSARSRGRIKSTQRK